MKMPDFPTLKALGLGCAACALAGCQPPGSDYLKDVGGPGKPKLDSGPYHKPPAIPDNISYWDGDAATGTPLIRINRDRQRAYFYKGGVLVGVSVISSGDEANGTQKGK